MGPLVKLKTTKNQLKIETHYLGNRGSTEYAKYYITLIDIAYINFSTRWNTT